MEKITGNESVNPLAWTEDQHTMPGLTIRQHYAGQFMAALMVQHCPPDRVLNEANATLVRHLAKAAVTAANHLIAELNNQPSGE